MGFEVDTKGLTRLTYLKWQITLKFKGGNEIKQKETGNI